MFKTECILKIVKNGWVTVVPFVYSHDRFGDIIVPAGFKTDLATIPRVFRRIVMPSTYGVRRPAVVHDYIYTGKTSLTRHEADQLLYDALREAGINYFLARAMYLSVRLFGARHWCIKC